MDLNEASPDQLTPEDCGETSPRLNKFICKYQECLKVFKAKKSLNDHTRIHKGEKPFLCSFNPCDKAFTQFSSLQKHERIHKGEKPYVCENCGKAFTQISNLKRHERSHRGERPHSCDVCAKEFTTSSNLKQHLQVHLQKESRDKFECNSCGKTYSYNSSLKKHLQEHNPEQPKTESPEDPVTSFQLRTEFRCRESFENARGLAQINAISEPLNFTINQNLHNFYELAYNPLTLPQNHFTVFQEFQRNLIMPGLVQNSVFGRGASDLSSLKRSVDANKMNPGRRAYKQHQHFHVHSLACEHIMILHQGHLDYLHDGKLHHVSSDGCLEEHELEISDQNPIACKPVNNNNNISTCGHNSHHNHFSKQTLSERNCANSSSCCNAVKDLPAVLPLNHHGTLEEMTSICKGDISFTKHVHSETCNHPMIIHNGHIDFIVEGKLHHIHEDHYDDHGSVHIVDKSFEIQKFTQIASRTNQIFPRYS